MKGCNVQSSIKASVQLQVRRTSHNTAVVSDLVDRVT